MQLDELSSLKNEILTAKCSGLIGALLSESFSISVPDVSISLAERESQSKCKKPSPLKTFLNNCCSFQYTDWKIKEEKEEE